MFYAILDKMSLTICSLSFWPAAYVTVINFVRIMILQGRRFIGPDQCNQMYLLGRNQIG